MKDKLQGRQWTRCLTRTLRQDNRELGIQRVQNFQGFTLIELLVAISIVGILASIAAPSWISWRNGQRITAAQDQALQVLREAQARSIKSKLELQVSFREVGQVVQWAIHPTNAAPREADWQSLPTGIQIDTAETTLVQSGNIYRVEFTHRGHIDPPLGRITFAARGGGRAKRCVVVSTILGAMRKASNNAVPDDGGRYCY